MLSLLFDVFINTLISQLTNNVLLSYRIFTVIEYICCTAFLYSIIQNPQFRKLILVLSLTFIGFAIFDLTRNSSTFDSTATGIVCLLILTYSIYYLFETIRNPANLFIYSTPNFWLVVALVIFFSGTFFLNIISNHSFENESSTAMFSLIISAFNILKVAFITVAFVIKPENTTNKKKPLPEL